MECATAEERLKRRKGKGRNREVTSEETETQRDWKENNEKDDRQEAVGSQTGYKATKTYETNTNSLRRKRS